MEKMPKKPLNNLNPENEFDDAKNSNKKRCNTQNSKSKNLQKYFKIK